MIATAQFRQLTPSDVPTLKAFFPEPASISHAKRIRIQSPTGRSFHGLFVDDELVAAGQIKRPTEPDEKTKLFRYPELCSVFVRPEYRGKGYAKTIMNGLECIAASEGYAYVCLIANDANRPAKRLYSALGYNASKRHRSLTIRGANKVYFVKRVTEKF